MRLKRSDIEDVGKIASDGELFYKNFQRNECRANNKSCSMDTGVMHIDGQKSVMKIPKLFGDVKRVGDGIWREKQQQQHKIQSNNNDDEKKIYKSKKKQKQPKHRDENEDDDNERINDKKIIENEMQQQVLPVVSDGHYIHTERSNGNINGILNVKISMAAEKIQIHDIEKKHHNQTISPLEMQNYEANSLNENQLSLVQQQHQHELEQQQLQQFKVDSSSRFNKKRSIPGQQQKHFDDQLSKRKNELMDDENLSKILTETNLKPYHRVKRLDVINQINHNDIDGLSNMDYDSLMKYSSKY